MKNISGHSSNHGVATQSGTRTWTGAMSSGIHDQRSPKLAINM